MISRHYRCFAAISVRIEWALGQARLAEDFQPAFPIEQIARNGAHLLLSLVSFCGLG